MVVSVTVMDYLLFAMIAQVVAVTAGCMLLFLGFMVCCLESDQAGLIIIRQKSDILLSICMQYKKLVFK